MPQTDCLLPWRTALDNAALALENAGLRRREARHRAAPLFAQFGLAGAELLRPAKLSGGMRQRVAFLRTLLAGKPVLLLDEPFGALDALTRAKLQDELMRIVAHGDGSGPSTVLMVTHDVDEAVLLADRIVMMTNGPAATIGEVLTIELPRPRDRIALAEDPRYHHCRMAVLEFLYRRQAHVEAA